MLAYLLFVVYDKRVFIILTLEIANKRQSKPQNLFVIFVVSQQNNIYLYEMKFFATIGIIRGCY